MDATSIPDQLLLAAIVGEQGKLALMSMRGAEAIATMIHMQEIIDRAAETDSDQRHIVRRLLVKLSKMSGTLPPSLFLDEIDCHGDGSIAGGSFADIFVATYCGRKVALKRLRCFQPDPKHKAAQLEAFCREALVWRQLKHPNILLFLGVDVKTFEVAGLHCMVSPWMENGNIMQCMAKLGGDIDDALKDRWVRETIEGLTYLHSERIVHGDLRGANILVDDKLSVQLADFGLAKFADASTASWGTQSGGSVRWTAPEVLDNGRASFKSDIYSFGCVCLEIYTQKQPFAEFSTDAQVIAHVLRGMHPDMHVTSSDTSVAEAVWSWVRSCWNEDTNIRPTSRMLAKTVPHSGPPKQSSHTIASSYAPVMYSLRHVSHRRLDHSAHHLSGR